MPTFRAVPPIAVALTALPLLLSACASRPPAAPAPETPPLPLLQTPQARAQFHVMAGTMAADRQQPGMAAKQYLQALDEVPDAKLAAQATGLALAAKDDALALEAAQKWLSIVPDDLEAAQVVVRLALRDDREDLAYAECRKLIAGHPQGVAEGYRYVSRLLGEEPQHDTVAMSVMQRLVADHDDLAVAHDAAALLALHFDQPEHAEQEARAALKLAPGALDPTMLLTAALARQGRLQEADAVLAPTLRSSGKPLDLRLGYARILMKYGYFDHARRQIEQVLERRPRDQDARLLLGLDDFQANRLDEAAAAFRALKAGDATRDLQVQYYLGRIAEAQHRYEPALRHYERVDQGDLALDADMHRAMIFGRMGRLDEASDLLTRLGIAYPQLLDQFVVTESEILLDANRPTEALATLNRALQDQPDDADLIYQRALVYDRSGRTRNAEADLRALLKAHPDDPRYLNGLGYMLAEHNPDDLDEAQALVQKALTQTPNDPAVMDSMGWVLYRQGHAERALPLLRKAYRLFPDPEVAAHLVTVLATLGERPQAQQLLHQALRNDPDNAKLHQAAQLLNP